MHVIGLSEDRILPSKALLRVVARFQGSKVDEERRLSDGRMAVAELVGSQGDGPSITAALHAMGRGLCTPNEPDCRRCPLRPDCQSAS